MERMKKVKKVLLNMARNIFCPIHKEDGKISDFNKERSRTAWLKWLINSLTLIMRLSWHEFNFDLSKV